MMKYGFLALVAVLAFPSLHPSWAAAVQSQAAIACGSDPVETPAPPRIQGVVLQGTGMSQQIQGVHNHYMATFTCFNQSECGGMTCIKDVDLHLIHIEGVMQTGSTYTIGLSGSYMLMCTCTPN